MIKLRIGQRIKLRSTWAGYGKYPEKAGTITELALGIIFIHLDDGGQLQVLQSNYEKVFVVVTD